MQQIKDDPNWSSLSLTPRLLKPVAVALDVGQRNSGGIGLVYKIFANREAHFSSFAFPDTPEGVALKAHCLGCLSRRRLYTLRQVHTLAFLLDPRYSIGPLQPSAAELNDAVLLRRSMAAAHDVRLALRQEGIDPPDQLPDEYAKDASAHVVREYTLFRARRGGALELGVTWEEETASDPLA